MKIFINPGHEPTLDPGTCHYGYREADIVLRIGRRVENYLRAVGLEVKLFQYDGLHEICADANSWQADLFVSIHCNSADNPVACGTETFYCYGSVEGKKLACCIQSQIVDSLGTVWRRVEGRQFAVLTGTNMPAVLVETAFLSNVDEAQMLIEREDDFARAIARGITDYLKNQNPMPDTVDIPKTDDRLSAHFNASEFACPCCGTVKVDSRLIELLEQLRSKLNVPIHITGGCHCPDYNADIEGHPQHVHGTAADITAPLAGYWRTRNAVEQIDFDGTGFFPPIGADTAWYIHVDTRNGGVGSHVVWEG